MNDVKRYAFQIHRRPYGLEEVSSGNLVMYSDYAKLEADALALREEVAALRARVVVVVPKRKDPIGMPNLSALQISGWNACLDELSRLNGKAVSEGLLRRIAEYGDDFGEAWEELRALLDMKQDGADD